MRTIYDEREADNIVELLFEHYMQWTRLELRSNQEQRLSESDLLKFHSALKQLRKNVPVQYVIGEVEFYGLTFRVNPSVLVPRPETEELVDLVVKENKKCKSLIDIGSGSGCISISYKRNAFDSGVVALDVSEKALDVVKQNSKLNNVVVDTIQMDILKWGDLSRKFDVVVSNPPYVLNSEKDKMEANVIDHEPHLALFVEDSDPLLFYHCIADFALAHLNESGRIYFEINELYGNEVAQCLQVRNFKDIRIVKDINGKDRIVAGQL